MCDRCDVVEKRIAEHQRVGGKTVTTGGKLARIIGTKVLKKSKVPVVRLVDVMTGIEFVMCYAAFSRVQFSGVA